MRNHHRLPTAAFCRACGAYNVNYPHRLDSHLASYDFGSALIRTYYTFYILLRPFSSQATTTSNDEPSQGAALRKRLRNKSMQYHPIGFWSNWNTHTQRAKSADYRTPPIYAQRGSSPVSHQATTPKWRWICWRTRQDAGASRNFVSI